MSLLLRLAGLLRSPWALFGFIVCTIGIVVWSYGTGKRHGVDQERAAQSKAVALAVERAHVAHEAKLRQRGWQDATEAAASRNVRAALRQQLAELAALPPKVLIKTKVVRDESGCDCAVPTLGDDFWLRFKSAGSQRDTADPTPTDAVPD